MDNHVADMRREISEKENLIRNLETNQTENWKTWDLPQKELNEIQIKRERISLNESRSELNRTLVAYNESQIVQNSLPFGKRMFSTDRAEDLQRRLAIPLSHDEVSTRQAPGRQDVVYIETFKALEKAQEVFGFDLSIEVRSEPSVLFQQNGKVVMKAIVRVTLANGCYHEDVGIGASMMNDPVEAVKMATKACVSDSIKRTLQHFGPALGSCLRDKEWVSTDLAPAVMASRGGKTPRQNEDHSKKGKFGGGNMAGSSHQQQYPTAGAGSRAQYQGPWNNPSSTTSSSSNSASVPTFTAPPQQTAKASHQQVTLALLEPPSFETSASSAMPGFPIQGSSASSHQPHHQNVPMNVHAQGNTAVRNKSVPPQQVYQQAESVMPAPSEANEDDLARAYDEAMRAFCESASTISMS